MSSNPAQRKAAQIKRGENSGLLEQVKKLCANYMQKVAYTNGFGSIAADWNSFFRLVSDAIDRAIAKWDPDKHRFIMVARFCFLKECRWEMQRRRDRSLQVVGERYGEDSDLFATLEDAGQKDPAQTVEREELSDIAAMELAREPETSRIIVQGWQRGLPYKSIAPVAGESPERCRKMRYQNIKRMQKRLRRRFDL